MYASSYLDPPSYHTDRLSHSHDSNFASCMFEDEFLHINRDLHKVKNFDEFGIALNHALAKLGPKLQLKEIVFCRYNPVFDEVRQVMTWPESPARNEVHETVRLFETMIEQQKSSRMIQLWFNEQLEEAMTLANPLKSVFPVDLKHGHGGFVYVEWLKNDSDRKIKEHCLKLFSLHLALIITQVEEVLELELATALYSELMNHTLMAVLVVDLNRCKVIAANTWFTQLTHYAAEEPNEFLNDLLISATLPEENAHDLEALSNKSLILSDKHKNQRHLYVNVAAIHESRYHALTFVDLSEIVTVETQLKETTAQMQDILNHTLDAIAHLTDYIDPYTSMHQLRTSKLSGMIAARMGLSEAQIRSLEIAAKLHDVGNIMLPPEIINKPGRYTEIEATLVKTHVTIGCELIKNIDIQGLVAEIILQHHERLDGSGYPLGLTSEAILQESKILAVANMADQMLSHRPYRPAYDVSDTIQFLVKDASAGRLDETAIKWCVELLLSGDWKP